MSRRRGQLELALRTTFPKQNLKDCLPSPKPKGRRSQGRGRRDLTGKGKSVPYQGRSVPHHMGSYTMGQLEGITFYGQNTCISYPLSILINGSSINMKNGYLRYLQPFQDTSLSAPTCLLLHSLFSWILHCPLFPGALTPFTIPWVKGRCCSTQKPHQGGRYVHAMGKVKATVNILSRDNIHIHKLAFCLHLHSKGS